MRFQGLASTWDEDTAGIRFARGAWSFGLEALRRRGYAELPLLNAHGRFDRLGRIPLDAIREDERGLLIAAEFDDRTPFQRNVADRVRRGELARLSVGYNVVAEHREGGTRVITCALLAEVSLVMGPRNGRAVILKVMENPAPQRSALSSPGAAREVSAGAGSSPRPVEFSGILSDLRARA